jgi:hypothetical protein
VIGCVSAKSTRDFWMELARYIVRFGVKV